jgi:hypothetical protein
MKGPVLARLVTQNSEKKVRKRIKIKDLLRISRKRGDIWLGRKCFKTSVVRRGMWSHVATIAPWRYRLLPGQTQSGELPAGRCEQVPVCMKHRLKTGSYVAAFSRPLVFIISCLSSENGREEKNGSGSLSENATCQALSENHFRVADDTGVILRCLESKCRVRPLLPSLGSRPQHADTLAGTRQMQPNQYPAAWPSLRWSEPAR